MSSPKAVGLGFVGTGMISDTYLENLTSFADVRVVIVGDLDQQRARRQAEKYDLPAWGTSEDVLAHLDVEIVVNLTIPAAHAEIASQAIAAGKHVWSEKPISIDRATGRALLDQAEAAGLLVGVDRHATSALIDRWGPTSTDQRCPTAAAGTRQVITRATAS
jgi:predicted dehydrogenase